MRTNKIGHELRLVIIGLLFCCSIIAVAGGTYASAASKKARAMKAYRSFLAKNPSKFVSIDFDWDTQNKEPESAAAKFMLQDLDGDKIPELLTWRPVSFKYDEIHVFTYKNGKVVPVKSANGTKAVIDISAQAEGYYKGIYVCKKHHLHTKWQSGSHYTKTVYKLQKGEMKTYLWKDYLTSDPVTFAEYAKPHITYLKYGESIKGKEFKALTVKCKKAKNGTFVKNTDANRKKYVK